MTIEEMDEAYSNLKTEYFNIQDELTTARQCIDCYKRDIFKLKKQFEIAKDFIKFVVRYDCKVVVPRDFSKYEACWFLIRSTAQEKLEQIEELDK